MNRDLCRAIGIIDKPRSNAHLYNVNKIEGLKDILNKDFFVWSDFDSWESIEVQQWIFARAMEIYRSKMIDIKCDCCNYIDFNPNVFKKIKEEKCFGKKSVYIIKKLVYEILLAKANRESDGTYPS